MLQHKQFDADKTLAELQKKFPKEKGTFLSLVTARAQMLCTGLAKSRASRLEHASQEEKVADLWAESIAFAWNLQASESTGAVKDDLVGALADVAKVSARGVTTFEKPPAPSIAKRR